MNKLGYKSRNVWQSSSCTIDNKKFSIQWTVLSNWFAKLVWIIRNYFQVHFTSKFFSLVFCSVDNQGARVADVIRVTIFKVEHQKNYAAFYKTSLWYLPKSSKCWKHWKEFAENHDQQNLNLNESEGWISITWNMIACKNCIMESLGIFRELQWNEESVCGQSTIRKTTHWH